MSSTTNGRDTILARIREASQAAGVHATPTMPPDEGRGGLPATFEDRGARTQAFAQRMEELRVSFVLCDTVADASEGISLLAQRSGWKAIASHNGGRLPSLLEPLKDRILRVDGDCDKTRLIACEAGVAECLALDAQTGAILLAPKAGGLELTSAPPTLVVFGMAQQITGSLAEALVVARSANHGALPPGLSILTGASHTSAIERRPIPRGHGPLQLVVYLALSED